MRGLSEMFNANFFLVSQANPYVLPLITLKRLAPWRIGSLVEGELKHRCKQLMEVLPAWLGANRVLKLINQPWEGDCTMVLPVTTFSTAKSVVNLSREDLLVALEAGKRATWGKLSAIQANCAIEATIDDCLRQVTAVANAQRRRKARRTSRVAVAPAPANGGTPSEGLSLRRGIPSWLHMPALGIMPRIESRGDGMGTPTWAQPLVSSLSSRSAFLPDSPPRAAMEQQPAPEALLLGSAAAYRNLQLSPSTGLLLQLAVQESLTDYSVPEESAEEQQEVAGAAGAAGRATPPDEALAEEPAPPSPSFESGRALWRDFFSVVPATTEAGAGSTSLDYIAP